MEPESNSEFDSLVGNQFHDRSLMEEALKEKGPASAGNKRLALLGDKILALILICRSYRKVNTTGSLLLLILIDILLIQNRTRDKSGSDFRL